MGWPKGKPRKVINSPPKIEVTGDSLNERVANYIHEHICLIPGCPIRVHMEDAKNIINIVKGS